MPAIAAGHRAGQISVTMQEDGARYMTGSVSTLAVSRIGKLMAHIDYQPVRVVEIRPQGAGVNQRCVTHLLLQPGFRFVGIVENLDIGVDESLRDPGAPRHPLAVGNDGNTLEIAGMSPRELDLFPGHIKGQPSHLAEIEEQIDRHFELDLVIDDFLEFPVIGQSKFAEYGHIDTVRLVIDDEHERLLLSLSCYCQFNSEKHTMRAFPALWQAGSQASGVQSLSAGLAREKWVAARPEAIISAIANQAEGSSTSLQNNIPNRLEKMTVL